MTKISFFQSPVTNTVPAASIKIVDVYNLIKSDKYQKTTEALRSLPKKDKQSFKSKNFDFVTFSGEFTRRNSKNLTTHSNYLVIDFDHLEDISRIKDLLLNDPLIKTVLLFVSPSGDGLKWVIPCDIKTLSHKDYYKAVSNYLMETYELEADASGSDVSRSCYLPYDPQTYISPSFIDNQHTILKNSFNPNDWLDKKEDHSTRKQSRTNLERQYAIQNYNGNDTQLFVEQLILNIEANKLDVTTRYEDWRNIGFALADEYGEEGRIYFHRLSQSYPGFNLKDCNKQYDACLNSTNTGITIGTLIHLLKTKINENSIIYNLTNNTKMTTKNLQAKISLPTSIYEMLPNYLKKITNVTDDYQEKDIILLGSLATLSAVLPNISGIYKNQRTYSNLNLFISAVAGAGKGNLNYCRKLVEPIHNLKQNPEPENGYALAFLSMSRRDNTQRVSTNSRRRNRSSNTEHRVTSQENQMLFIPANNSASGAYQLLGENNGEGLLFETEGDTLANAFKSDHGDYSDGLRKAFHHESISMFRRTENEWIEIKDPKLSCVLSGTPKQISNLIPNAENGLMSRFLFYNINPNVEWKNVFADDKIDYNETFETFGNQYLEFYKRLKNSDPITFSFSREQKEKFHNHFFGRNEKFLFDNGNNSIAIIRRIGIMMFRIAMILTLLRHMDKNSIPTKLVCDDIDFRIALEMMEVMTKHSEMVYRSLSKESFQSRLNGNGHKFYDALPAEFTKDDYVKAAESIGIKVRTAEGYITRFVKWKYIERLQKGEYKKADLSF